MIRRFLSVFAAMALLPAITSAQPQAPPSQGAEQLLQQAEKHYEQLEYEAALKTLIQVHQAKGVTPMQRARSFLYMGVCFTALGSAENAVLAFVELLKIKPRFRLPGGISPSIKAMFKEALTRLKLPETPPPEPEGDAAAAPGEAPVKVRARGPRTVVAGQPIEIKVTVDDPRQMITALRVRWRRRGGPDFSTVKVGYKSGQDEVRARIPGATLKGKTGRVLYFVEALGKGGMTLAHAGDMEQPLTVKLTEAPEGESNWGWWALGIGGTLAVAGGIVAAVLLTRGGGENGDPDRADVTITIH